MAPQNLLSARAGLEVHPLVLIVEGRAPTASLLAPELSSRHLRLLTAFSADEAKAAVTGELAPDLILLDQDLLGAGLEFLRELRADPETAGVPVIVVSGDDTPDKRRTAFDLGADDYVARPFDPGEMVRRIMAVLRRASPSADRPPRGRLGSGPIRLDLRNHSLIVDGRETLLPKAELEILGILMAHENSLVSRASMVEALNLPPGGSRSVDMRVQRVRRRLGRYAPWIETVHGQGYRYRNPDRGSPRQEEVA